MISKFCNFRRILNVFLLMIALTFFSSNFALIFNTNGSASAAETSYMCTFADYEDAFLLVVTQDSSSIPFITSEVMHDLSTGTLPVSNASKRHGKIYTIRNEGKVYTCKISSWEVTKAQISGMRTLKSAVFNLYKYGGAVVGFSQNNSVMSQGYKILSTKSTNTSDAEKNNNVSLHVNLSVPSSDGLKWFNTNYFKFKWQVVTILNDIDLTGERWTPIGYGYSSVYTRIKTFDGNNKKISNFKIVATQKDQYYHDFNDFYAVGFFSTLQGTVIKNVWLDNESIEMYDHSAKYSTQWRFGYGVGGLVGYASNLKVQNSQITNSSIDVVSNYWNWSYYSASAGGLIGCVGNNSEVKISDVFVNCDLSVCTKEGLFCNAGGIVGFGINITKLEITKTFYKGNIKLDNISKSADYLNAGGIVGIFAMTVKTGSISITNCLAYVNNITHTSKQKYLTIAPIWTGGYTKSGYTITTDIKGYKYSGNYYVPNSSFTQTTGVVGEASNYK